MYVWYDSWNVSELKCGRQPCTLYGTIQRKSDIDIEKIAKIAYVCLLLVGGIIIIIIFLEIKAHVTVWDFSKPLFSDDLIIAD